MLLAFASAVAIGCGGDEDAPEFEGGEKEQVAATVRTAADAMGAGEGEKACPLITDRGQRELLRIMNRLGADVSTCEEAVAAIPGSRFRPGNPHRTPDQVHISADDPDYAWMDCGESGGAFLLRRMEDGWMVNHTYCVH